MSAVLEATEEQVELLIPETVVEAPIAPAPSTAAPVDLELLLSDIQLNLVLLLHSPEQLI
jgi:hypothetical protein